jgi:hypothetical protein
MANEQQPPVLMQANGTAPILSYNVPEPTSYSGRNYIDLQIDGSYWKADPGLEPNGPLPQPESAAAGMMAMRMMDDGMGLLAKGEEDSAPIYVPDTGVTDEPVFGTTTPEVMMLPEEPWDPEPEPEEWVQATFSSHSTGATLSGPHTGAQVTFSGIAEADFGVSKVEFKVGAAVYQRATVSGSTWSYTHTFTQPGTSITLKVLVTSASGKQASKSITVNVALDPAPDTVDPLLTIQSPADGTALVQGPSGTQVVVQGTASDAGSGVQAVQINQNNGGWANVTPVRPASPPGRTRWC